MLNIAAWILGPDPATRGALIWTVGLEWFENPWATPKRATFDDLGHTIIEVVGAAI